MTVCLTKNTHNDCQSKKKKRGTGATHQCSNKFERLGWCLLAKNLPFFLPHAAGCLQKDAFKLKTNEFEVSSLVCSPDSKRDKYANFAQRSSNPRIFFCLAHPHPQDDP